jgi:CubicO group peptidase (beta-lactamase class C family)
MESSLKSIGSGMLDSRGSNKSITPSNKRLDLCKYCNDKFCNATYTDDKVENPTGMKGSWIPIGDNNVFWSNARSAARFGLLLLNRGIWDQSPVLPDNDYFAQMINSSQTLNHSYGYLTWLNGKSTIILPRITQALNLPLTTHAPADLFAALGKDGQIIAIVPSERLVVVRFGEAPDANLVPIDFHNELWKRITALKK